MSDIDLLTENSWDAARDDKRFAAADAARERDDFARTLEVAAEIVRKLDGPTPAEVGVRKSDSRISVLVPHNGSVEAFALSVFGRHLLPEPVVEGSLVSYSREIYGCDVKVWGSPTREDHIASLEAELAKLKAGAES